MKMAVKQSNDDRFWRGRPVMWGTRSGVAHVVVRAVLYLDGVAQTGACGIATNTWGLKVATWNGIRKNAPRVCRKCVELLVKAGRDGEIGQESK